MSRPVLPPASWPPQQQRPPRRLRWYRLLFGISLVPLVATFAYVLLATSVNATDPGEFLHRAFELGVVFGVFWVLGVLAWFADL